MTPTSPKNVRRGGSGRPSSPVPEPLRRVGDDFEDEYPGASALATECFANLCRAADLLMELHNRQTREEYQLSPSARQVLAVVEGAGQPLEPTVIAERLLITTGSMTSVLDTLEKRGLIRRMPHPDDRRKLLVDITPDAQAILDELLPSLHARERDVISSALSTPRATRAPAPHRQSPARRPPGSIDAGPTRRHPSTTVSTESRHAAVTQQSGPPRGRPRCMSSRRWMCSVLSEAEVDGHADERRDVGVDGDRVVAVKGVDLEVVERRLAAGDLRVGLEAGNIDPDRLER